MESEQSAPQGVFVARLVLGLAQGLALYLLYSAFDQKAWPATAPLLFAPLAVVAMFIPFLVSQALGNLRSTTLIIWSLAASLIVAGLACYDVWHAWPGEALGIEPSPRALLVCAVFLFVAHALVSCGDQDRRIVAHYPTLFDLAWKLGVQVGIIVCFTSAFWIMVRLGIALFDMIKLTGFSHFIGHPWVAIPLTTITAAAAIHVTDTRANLVRGVRTLALTLLGWLLPVITLIAFAFLISLVFTGLTPLWETRSATFLLMAAAVVLIIHINAAYQDGDPEHRPPHILRVADTLAAVLLIFIVWIAGYALWLRVGQYGWTVDRITSAAGVLIAGVFAVGYLIAALLPGLWLKLIERWNVYGTFVFLIVLFALTTPIADPMRLAVADQMHRLQSGVVIPAKFDFFYLYRHGGRFGHDALEELSRAKNKSTKEGAEAALKGVYIGPDPRTVGVRTTNIARSIKVYPAGKSMPRSFLQQDWMENPDLSTVGMNCLLGEPQPGAKCDAVLVDLDNDGAEEIILILDSTMVGEVKGRPWWDAEVFKWDGKSWRYIGLVRGRHCSDDYEALLAGRFKAVPPERPLPDLEIGGRRLSIAPNVEADNCQR